MFNQPLINFLYSPYLIEVIHSDGFKEISGTGTGFVLETGTGIPYIVTNRHVIDLDYRQSTSRYKKFELINLILSGRRTDDSHYSIRLNFGEYYTHDDEENDVIIIKPTVSQEETNSFHFHFSYENLADDEVYKRISPLDMVSFSGFPDTHDKLMGRPIIRSGRIASDPRFNYSWNKTSHGDCVAYEGFSTGGGSGSPILAPSVRTSDASNRTQGFLIGINAGHIPGQNGHTGISYFYKSTVLIDIIEKNRLREVK